MENIGYIICRYFIKIFAAGCDKDSTEIHRCRANQQPVTSLFIKLPGTVQLAREKMENPFPIPEIAEQVDHWFDFFGLDFTKTVKKISDCNNSLPWIVCFN